MSRILVIDDSPTTVAFLRSRLARSGHTISALTSFVELPSRLESDVPDVVVLDLHMPAMSGVMVAGFIRRHQPRPIPIIVYSSQPDAELRAAGQAIGAVATVTKSADATALLHEIAGVLGSVAIHCAS